MNLPEKIFKAGVIGAGGAGFPSHVKANAKAEIFLVNGAECEPLVHKDVELMKNFPGEIVSGLNLMIRQVCAKKAYFGIKEKNTAAIESIGKKINNDNTEISLLGDFYPSGDEYELVYSATKRLIPPHGIPLDVGCVVNNVETLYNISRAEKDIPLTDKFVSVNGLVNEPKSFWAPVGTSFRDLINAAGGTKIKEYSIFVSGLLMGRLTFDVDEPVTKTIAGLIILPKDHYLVKRMNRPVESMNRIGKSACDQCSYCTEFCPRYLLGYDVQPHKVMRSLAFSKTGSDMWNQYADLCCSCGLCSLYACPEDLYPREACNQSKTVMRKQNRKYEQIKPVKVHPIKEGRRVPLKMLMKRLNVQEYDFKTPFDEIKISPESVKVLLKQHTGEAANPLKNIGEKTNKGEMIAKPGEGKLGAVIHSPIDGTVTEVTKEFIRIRK